MAAAAKYAHDRGLRFGLYDNETESLTDESGKKERISDISYLIKTFHADFYRSDCTAGPAIQGKFGPGHRAHYAEDVLYWSTKGFYEVLDTVYADTPTFLWENCHGGGAIKDFGASRRAAKIQNQDRYYPIDARRSFYDASYVFPPMQLAALDGSWGEWQASGSVYEFRSASMGAAYWHPDAPNGGNGGPVWSAEHKAVIKRAVATYKNKLRPLIRNADLYHIFPRPDGMHWDGVEYFDPAAKRGVVYLFKPAEMNGNDVTKVKLRGLRPAARYRVTFEDGTNPSVEKSGAELAAGIDVGLRRGNLLGHLVLFLEQSPDARVRALLTSFARHVALALRMQRAESFGRADNRGPSCHRFQNLVLDACSIQERDNRYSCPPEERSNVVYGPRDGDQGILPQPFDLRSGILTHDE